MDRRTFLTGCSGVTAVTIAGCTASEDDSTSGQDGQGDIEQHPEDVLEELRSVLEEGDGPEPFLELLHSDAPARAALDDPEPGRPPAVIGALHYSVEEHELVEETDTEAAICGRNSESEPIARFEFRAEDGEWKLWDATHARVGYYPDDPEDFEECGKLVIRVHRLPEPARIEAETALEEGRYETDDEPYLPSLLDPEESYLAVEREDSRTEYRLLVEREAETTVLELEETIASWGEESLTIENDTDDTVTVDIRVTRNRTEELVVDETLTIDPGSEANTEPYDREFGSYTASIETDEFADEIGWGEGENELPWRGFIVTDEGIGIVPAPMLEPIDCQEVWQRPIEFSDDCEPIQR